MIHIRSELKQGSIKGSQEGRKEGRVYIKTREERTRCTQQHIHPIFRSSFFFFHSVLPFPFSPNPSSTFSSFRFLWKYSPDIKPQTSFGLSEKRRGSYQLTRYICFFYPFCHFYFFYPYILLFPCWFDWIFDFYFI